MIGGFAVAVGRGLGFVAQCLAAAFYGALALLLGAIMLVASAAVAVGVLGAIASNPTAPGSIAFLALFACGGALGFNADRDASPAPSAGGASGLSAPREEWTFVQQDDEGSLWDAGLDSGGPIRVVEVVNATAEPDGTHRTFVLRVPPETETAREGVAWTFEFDDPDEYVVASES